ncbi:hypothetical protein [Flavobacterium hungaricum]|uniref:Uncharacterized protein n=1 Tax=Flavobacterium hungaricum TaxID=2082725 RepID=A0ABR9TG43_9FLAO|nr:hypothetical protein [Flavobacterium hungaricum]MBE8724225.1 hypothetical protein [Flavobacterium hungaricum]
MEEQFKSYEKTIQKKHSFGMPKYKEQFRTSLSKTLFIALAEKAVLKLGWHLTYKNENSIEAKRNETSFGIDKWTEAITITFDHGNVEVKSESLGNEIWDIGRNSKRVKLFIYAFKETEKEFDKEALNELEAEIEKKNNWDDYSIPEHLPAPTLVKKKQFPILVLGGALIALLLGLIVAEVSIHVIYIIGVFEVLAGLAIAYSLKFLIQIANFVDLKKIQYVIIAMVFIVYSSNQYFQYLIVLNENDISGLSFYEFLQIIFSEGLFIKKINTGWIGLVLSWVVQLVLTYYIAVARVSSIVMAYQIEKIPVEVIDFSFYHIVKGKSENEVRKELAAKGWTDKENQDEVFEAMAAIGGVTELQRMK